MNCEIGAFLMAQWYRAIAGLCLQCRRPRFEPQIGKIPSRGKWLPAAVVLPGESHGQRNLMGYSPWGRKESDMTEQLPLAGPQVESGAEQKIFEERPANTHFLN